jgi:hypothetical protein
MLRPASFLLLSLVWSTLVGAIDIQECMNTQIVNNWSSESDPYTPVERFNGNEYAYISSENDVAPCQGLLYKYDMGPGIDTSSGKFPLSEDVEYAQRSYGSVHAGQKGSLWDGNTACKFQLFQHGRESPAPSSSLTHHHLELITPTAIPDLDSLSLTIYNATDPDQKLTRIMATDIYVKSEIPRLESCLASLNVPTPDRNYVLTESKPYQVDLTYDPKSESSISSVYLAIEANLDILLPLLSGRNSLLGNFFPRHLEYP